MTEEEILRHRELDLEDMHGRMLQKLNEDGFIGSYNDEKTAGFEKAIHDGHFLCMIGEIQPLEYKKILLDFYYYYVSKGEKRIGKV